MSAPQDRPFVGRGALKLDHALGAFALEVSGLRCADFGCSTGGFTDCLLRRGAARVYAVDTGYGVIDYRLRTDDRVSVMERTNALHADPPVDGPVDLVVIDLGWTTQEKCVPAALRWLADRDRARIVTLIKPHYEAKGLGMEDRLDKGVLDEASAETILSAVLDHLPALGVDVLATTKSPIAGGKGKSKGNVEYLALLRMHA